MIYGAILGALIVLAAWLWKRRGLSPATWLRLGAAGIITSFLFPPFRWASMQETRFLGYAPLWHTYDAGLWDRSSIDYPLLMIQCAVIAGVAILLWLAQKR